MDLDIRLPIGLLFLAFGVILVACGLLLGPAAWDAHSLGVNIDLDWGVVMLAFGGLMTGLALSRRRKPD